MKKRLPIEQLRASAKIAVELAKKKGLITDHSVIDELQNDPHAPMLPGLPAYLPHEWTLTASITHMHELVFQWVEHCKKKKIDQENITAFVKFVDGVFVKLTAKADREMTAMEKLIKRSRKSLVLHKVFAPMRKKETESAMHKFIIDSFAVSILVKKNSSTSEYVEWFAPWVAELYALWKKHDKTIMQKSKG